MQVGYGLFGIEPCGDLVVGQPPPHIHFPRKIERWRKPVVAAGLDNKAAGVVAFGANGGGWW